MTKPILRRPGQRGFTLIEALASLTIASVVVVSAIGTVGVALKTEREQRHAWLAFSIAQSKMEELGAVDKGDALLAEATPDVITASQIGTEADAQCNTGVDHSLTPAMTVNDLGIPVTGAPYRLCWKVTVGFPIADLRTVRVVVEYPAQGGTKSVLLQLTR